MHTIAVCLLSSVSLCISLQESERGADARRQKSVPGRQAQDEKPQERVFSGPQKGEKLPPLPVRLIGAEEPIDCVKQAGDNPVLLVFFHKLTRPAFGLTRALGAFGESRAKDKLQTIVVFLVEDETAAERQITNVRGRLPKSVRVGISPDGLDGPGAWGLNRNVTLTVIAADKGRVVSNWGLVQPGAQADAPKIMKSVVGILGSGEVPDVEKLLGGYAQRMRRDPKLERLIGPLLRRKLSDAEVVKGLAAVDEYVGNMPARKRMLGQSASEYVRGARMAEIPNEAVRVKVREWARMARPMRQSGDQKGRDKTGNQPRDPQVESLLRPFVQKTATDEEVVAMAKRIEDYVAKNPVAKGQIGDICRRIVGSTRLETYGTARCREYLKKWAKDFQPPKKDPAKGKAEKSEKADRSEKSEKSEKAKRDSDSAGST